MLALYAVEVPLGDWLGVALVLLALMLFLVDLKATNHGAPAVGGIVALVVGALVLFDADSLYSWVPLVTLVTVVVLVGALFVGIFGGALVAGEQPATTGAEGMVGEVGVVRMPVGSCSEGWVFVRGELWRAVVAIAPEDAHGEQDGEPAIEIGRKVQVVGIEDGKILVLPLGPVES